MPASPDRKRGANATARFETTLRTSNVANWLRTSSNARYLHVANLYLAGMSAGIFLFWKAVLFPRV
ncbi:hypothetical protein BU16DRAFT_526478 [Lophium mytilinum]|uniref:Uncharacterized protein n=1 Tax=Lophium mytilinum TaxID=390894 RepID=A0A6A6QU59_9PEZI|nr:hypothetical protein BU16DRAFT_526478 [Lophium mytilinum]